MTPVEAHLFATKVVNNALDAPDASPEHAKPILIELVKSGLLMVEGINRLQVIMADIRDDLKEAQRQQKALIK